MHLSLLLSAIMVIGAALVTDEITGGHLLAVAGIFGLYAIAQAIRDKR